MRRFDEPESLEDYIERLDGDYLRLTLLVSKDILNDAVYNYPTARFLRDRLHEDIDKCLDAKLEELRT
jgi:hypothetical protein